MEWSFNPVVRYLDKPTEDFQREDLARYIFENRIQTIHFHYEGIDGKIKELKFPVQNEYYLNLILAEGERVDGSSLFKSILEAGKSDLYVIPMYKTAFQNPFDPHSLDLFCRFFDRSGNPAPNIPCNILYNADEAFKKKTGLTLNNLVELEFYLIFDRDDQRFPAMVQQGYHQSSPFIRGSKLATKILTKVAEITNSVKYCHSEVGYIDPIESDLPELKNKRLEQYELEMNLAPITDMSYYVSIAKWIIRNVAKEEGINVSFAPKLMDGMAGNGMHVHMAVMKGKENMLTHPKGELTDIGHQLVGGILEYSDALVGMGNTVPSSFLRLVPNQEAPTKVCWSDINRSTLIRVPLGWRGVGDMAKVVNPRQRSTFTDGHHDPTIELRSPDSTAFISLLFAGILVAATDGLTKSSSIDYAKSLYVQGDIFKDPDLLNRLHSLPSNCYDAAQILKRKRSLFEKDQVFPPMILDYLINHLEKQEDQKLHQEFSALPPDKRPQLLNKTLQKDLHYH